MNNLPAGVRISGSFPPQFSTILSHAALDFVATLERTFGDRRRALLQKRAERQVRIDNGEMPDWLPETASVRNNPTWRVGPIPDDLQRFCFLFNVFVSTGNF